MHINTRHGNPVQSPLVQITWAIIEITASSCFGASSLPTDLTKCLVRIWFCAITNTIIEINGGSKNQRGPWTRRGTKGLDELLNCGE